MTDGSVAFWEQKWIFHGSGRFLWFTPKNQTRQKYNLFRLHVFPAKYYILYLKVFMEQELFWSSV